MNEHNKKLLDMGMLVLADLRAYLFDCRITGGFPRDVASHNTAKDLDICVFNFHPNDIAESKFYEQLVLQLKDSFDSVEVFDQYPNDEDGQSADEFNNNVGHIPAFRQVHSVIKIVHEGLNVDIIFIDDCHPNPCGMYARFNKGARMNCIEYVVSLFDCNVNMFVWDEEQNSPRYIGPNLRQFVVMHSNLGPERLAKNYRNWIGFSNDLDNATFQPYNYI